MTVVNKNFKFRFGSMGLKMKGQAFKSFGVKFRNAGWVGVWVVGWLNLMSHVSLSQFVV